MTHLLMNFGVSIISLITVDFILYFYTYPTCQTSEASITTIKWIVVFKPF